MKCAIVTTTINHPTEAIEKFASKPGWELIVVGDLKTPHQDYQKYNYLSPDYQKNTYPILSDMLGWNVIQRRNIGLIEAYLQGYDIIATVDDDNIPYDFWGTNCLVGQEVELDNYTTNFAAFDPLSVTNQNHLWHRGFPVELVKDKNTVSRNGKTKIKVLVQADLWDGEADVDAIERISMNTNNYITGNFPYTADKPSPFNSQNTFLAREAIPDFFLFPNVGRMDDIWASYHLQHIHGQCVVYNKPSVFQKRNEHRLINDIKAELMGIEHSLNVVKNSGYLSSFLPQTWLAFQEYKRILKSSL